MCERKLYFLSLALVLGISFSATAQTTTLHVLGDSFASNFDNTTAPFDWPILLDLQDQYSVELNARPGARLVSDIAPSVEETFSQSQAEILLIAAGLNDFLTNFADAAPGADFNEPSFDQYFESGSQFTSRNSWNVLRITTERIVDQWREDRPDRPVLIFNIPPYDQFLADQGGFASIKLGRSVAYNNWLETYVNDNEDLTLFDIRSFLEDQGDYYAEELPTARLHPDAETQAAIALEVGRIVSTIAVPEPSGMMLVVALLHLAATRRLRN